MKDNFKKYERTTAVIVKRHSTNIEQVRQIQLNHKMENRMTIDIKRFITSGLVAGVIIIIIGFGLVPIIGNEMNDVLKAENLKLQVDVLQP